MSISAFIVEIMEPDIIEFYTKRIELYRPTESFLSVLVLMVLNILG